MNLPEAMAIQPYAVAKDSQHKYLMRRLLEAILSPESKKHFVEVGLPVDRRGASRHERTERRAASERPVRRRRSAGGAAPAAAGDGLFLAGLSTLLGSYVAADRRPAGGPGVVHLAGAPAAGHGAAEEIRYALRLSLLSCTLSTLLSLWVAIPAGYVLSRFTFPGQEPGRRHARHPHRAAAAGDRAGAADPVPDAAGPGHRAGRAGHVRRAQRGAGPVHRGLRVRRADDAGHVRPDQPAAPSRWR